MKLSKDTIYNMLSVFNFVSSKTVKKCHDAEWIKNDFVHELFPEIKFIMYYKLTKTGFFTDKFSLNSFEVLSVESGETILKFVKNADTKNLDEIDFDKKLPEGSVRDNFKNLRDTLASFVRIV
jgi:hypothetical protein